MLGSISGFLDGISRIGKFAARWDDDFFDRINHRYSTIVLLLFTIIVSTKQYVGEPIVCWCPALFSGPMVEYTHQVCWISNTYYLPPNKAPLTKDQPRELVLIYYQWVPFILLAEAFLFQVTNILWIAMSGKNGINVNRLVMMVAAAENVHPEVRDKTIRTVVEHLDQAITYSYWKNRAPCWKFCNSLKKCFCWLLCGRSFGNYLTVCYLFCKLLYIVNAAGQLYLLNYLLGAEQLGVHFSMFGIYVVKLLLAGQEVAKNTKIFPRVTMCDFTIRQFSNLQDYTVECSLPINLFSEKFFIFLWFWIVSVFFANIYSLLSWLWSIFTVSRVNYVKKYVKLVEKVHKNRYERKHIACFAEEYLRQDGIFYLRMLSANANDVLVAQMIACLWRHYKTKHMSTEEYHKPHPTQLNQDDIEGGNNDYQEQTTHSRRSSYGRPAPPYPTSPKMPTAPKLPLGQKFNIKNSLKKPTSTAATTSSKRSKGP